MSMERVVSLTCSNTEIVCALGLADRLVGVDEHSDFPVEVVKRLPRVGPDLGIDIDKVAALKPDLVLASLTVPGHERIVERLERAGLPFMAPEPVSVADVYRDIRAIAERLGVPERGERLVSEMKSVLERPQPTRPPVSILVEWWPKPVIVPGSDSWVTQLLDATGGHNPFADRAVKSTPISLEEARAAAPDAIVISWCGVRPEKYRPDIVYKRPGWQELQAVRARRVFCVPEAYLGRPGPRLVEGHRALERIVDSCRQSNERFSASSI
jgi:iron complex transport system substrate-binding protein